jgi:translation initiation factor IF-3
VAEAKEAAKQQAPEVKAEIPANGGLFANAKISADALKKLTESEDE